VPDTPVANTDLKRNLGNTKDSLRDWIQLQGVSVLLVRLHVKNRTSANTAPYLIVFSTALSVDPLIHGE